VADGNCYTWQDGVNGVITPALNQTTTFALDVVQTEGAGHSSVVAVLTTTVEVTVPLITQNSYIDSIFGGRVLRLHWLAFNAKSCTLTLDGATIDAAAPTDTYTHGYLYVPPDDSGPRTFAVIAHAATGSAQASLTFPPQRITPMTRLDLDWPGSIAITPDGKTALVTTGYPDSAVTVIDVETRTAEPATIPLPELPQALALTPDGSLALVTMHDGNLRMIDVPGRKLEPTAIPARVNSWAIAITPDGRTALIGNERPNITVIDIARQKAEAPIVGTAAVGIDITPDGRTALVGNETAPNITVIDIAGRKAEAPIVGTAAVGIDITPDGKLALATSLDGTLTVIDLATRTSESTRLPVGSWPLDIAITPDGALAFVANYQDNTVRVMDIARRTVEPKTIPTADGPFEIAFTPDSSLAVISSLSLTNSGSFWTIVDVAQRTSVIGARGGGSFHIAITPDGTTALVGGADETTYLAVI
jgi:YVTN family beta-propeller protein